MLDEVDQHADTRVLYDLYRVRGLSMVVIANRERELLAQLDDRVASRLRTATSIRFDRYAESELVSILGDRVRWGLCENAVTTEQLEAIATAAAGDARVAIGTLRAAARRAVDEGRDRITDEFVAAAEPEAKAEIQQRTVEKLTPDQRLVYDIIRDRGEVAPGDLYDAYWDRADDPRTRRTIRNYLRKLRHYNLIAAEGEGRQRTYRPVS